MPDHVYRSMELTGSSRSGMEDAIQNAIARAARTTPKLRWFEVVETRGHIEDDAVAHWQVTIKVGYHLDD